MHILSWIGLIWERLAFFFFFKRLQLAETIAKDGGNGVQARGDTPGVPVSVTYNAFWVVCFFLSPAIDARRQCGGALAPLLAECLMTGEARQQTHDIFCYERSLDRTIGTRLF
jgi:hypothetical protein